MNTLAPHASPERLHGRELRKRVTGYVLFCGLALLGVSCLEPASSNKPGYSHRVLAKGTAVPHVDEEAQLATAIKNNDGLGGDKVPLHRAWVDGTQVYYWNFGEASSSTQSVWLFRRRGSTGEAQAFGHPNLIDSVPGDATYSPLRVPYLVFVTSRYDGELITSFEALEDAMELGLVEEPVAQQEVVQWPVTRSTVSLSVPDGRALAPAEAFYRGRRVSYLVLDTVTEALAPLMLSRGRVTPGEAYDLERERQGVVLDEEALGADLNEDGDMVDSNRIFSLGPADAGYSGLVAHGTVTVAGDYEFGAITAQGALFETGEYGSETTDDVIHYEADGVTYFMPIAGAVP